MSGIVGLWNLNGRPAEARVLSAMSHTLRHRGADGEASRLAGAVGFAAQHMWITAEEVGEMQPLVNQRGGVMLVMDGRLDSRDELVTALRLAPDLSDAACALAAYEAWGESFAMHLNGDFALAIFDEPQQRLLLVRDSIGIRPLYYFRSDRLFAFASEIKALLAHPDIPARPDDEGIADLMVVGSRPIDRQDLTCFEGIAAVVPAHVTLVTPQRTASRRYWDFDTGRTLQLRSFDEYVDAFRERFATAVRRRTRSVYPIAVSVSGGLDSSSIFCQTQQLKSSARRTPPTIVGISFSGAEGSSADERRYIREIEREYGVPIELFPMDPFVGCIDGMSTQVTAAEAPLLDYSWGVTSELYRRAVSHWSRVILTGHWGDQVLFSSAYLADLFWRFAWRDIGMHTRTYTRHFGSAETRVLEKRIAADIIRHYVPTSLVAPLKRLRLRLFGQQREKRWFSDAFLQKALRFAGVPATIGSGFHSAHARSIYLEARSKYHVYCMEWNNKAAAAYGLSAAFPYLDRDLLALLMATPGEIAAWQGVPRALLRAAMRGVLPEMVRTRRDKADFTAVANRGAADGAGIIAAVLSPEPLGVQLGYFDRERLVPEIARLRTQLTGTTCAEAWDLGDLLGLEVWLQVFLAHGEDNSRSQTGKETTAVSRA
jgi:asparagine synthase (glutamine-hydrolysing)